MRKEKSFNYQIQYLCKKIIERYKRNNEVNNYLNLRLVFENFVKSSPIADIPLNKLTLDDGYSFLDYCLQIKPNLKRRYWISYWWLLAAYH